ncbi:MAG: 4Fe-4S binding protein [Candidatus Marinimicrobia bacterium]|nr:4Fe-4S binding protein [Candidatus Neomarinimicrobiota bacterium]MBL7109599.1 4Fe-4S binding protein [Candidatus Neomarinimicrobiota bacterium]
MMNNFTSNIHYFRRISQVLAIGLIIIIPFSNLLGIHWVSGTLYSMSFGSLDFSDPSLILQTLVLVKKISLPFFISGIIPLLLAMFLGKVFCSWICPFHLLSEWAYKLIKKIKKISSTANKNPKRNFNLVIFFGLLLFIFLSEVPIFSLVSLPGIISSQVADLVIIRTLGIEIFIIILVLLLEMFSLSRFWCKYACPVGLSLGLTKFKNSLSIVCDSSKCGKCPQRKQNPCKTACSFNLNPKELGIYPVCNNCIECVSVCNENNGALQLTFNLVKKTNIRNKNNNHNKGE